MLGQKQHKTSRLKADMLAPNFCFKTNAHSQAKPSINYYPFGISMVGYSNAEYHYSYGMNTQEKDDEIYGEGNSYSAEYWQYDARLGRRWNVDPRDVASFSPYSCFANNPIWFSDVYGDSASSTSDGAVQKPAEHTVESGDNLWKIAKANYQEHGGGKTFEEYWKGIQEWNSGVKMVPGAVVVIEEPTVVVENSRAWHPPMMKLKHSPAPVSNVYDVKVYGTDIVGQGYGTMKLYSTYNNPSGMPSWEAKSSGWSIGFGGFGASVNPFVGIHGTITFDPEWISKTNPNNISDIANNVKFEVVKAGSIAFGGYIVAYEIGTMNVVGRSGFMKGAGWGAGIDASFTQGGFKESPTDTVNTFLLNLKYGRGDTAAQKKFLEAKGVKRD